MNEGCEYISYRYIIIFNNITHVIYIIQVVHNVYKLYICIYIDINKYIYLYDLLNNYLYIKIV